MVLPLLIPAAVSLASEFFPLLVTKIAGDRAGEVAEKVVDTAAAVAGLPRDAEPREIIERIKGDQLALEKIRYEFELLNQQEHERILEDRQNAREYQMAIGERGRRRGDIMLAGVSIGLAVCVALVLVPQFIIGADGEPSSLSTGELALVTTVAGALLKMLSDAFAFEFGSSRGSKEKDSQIKEFKDALVKVGSERQVAADELIRSQSRRLATTEDAIARAIVTAPAPVAAAAAGAAPTTAAAPRERDFVADLVAGRV